MTRSAMAMAVVSGVAAAMLAGPARSHDRPLAERLDLAAVGRAMAGGPSPMARDWEAHRLLPFDRHPPVAWVMPSRAAPADRPEVLGFLPYWNVGQALLRFDRLTTLAYFAVEVRGDGTLGDTRHWGTADLAPMVDAAKAAGVRVVLAVTCFDATAMGTLLPDAAKRAKAIAALAAAVKEAGGDGVNVDFEGLPLARKADFVKFVTELKAGLDEALGTSHVTVDTPAIDWSDAYDYDKLALAGDGLVIMGYDYHWRGGDPGPVSPLASSATWGTKNSLTWTLDDYDTYGGVENRGRFVLALPLYGYDWPVKADVAPGVATAKATARFYADCGRRAADADGWRWDDASTTPWFGWKDGGAWRQTWCEDRRSLETKVALVAARNLGGVAFWALGYEEDSTDPWDALDASYPPPPVEPVPDGPADGEGPTDLPGGSSDAWWLHWPGAEGIGRPDGTEPGLEIPEPGGPDEAGEVPEAGQDASAGDLSADAVAPADPGTDARQGGGGGCSTAGAGTGAAAAGLARVLAAFLALLGTMRSMSRARRRAGPGGPAYTG